MPIIPFNLLTMLFFKQQISNIPFQNALWLQNFDYTHAYLHYSLVEAKKVVKVFIACKKDFTACN